MAREDPDSIEVGQLILIERGGRQRARGVCRLLNRLAQAELALSTSRPQRGLEELFRPRRLNGRCRFS
jgi:hypothetical protein